MFTMQIGGQTDRGVGSIRLTIGGFDPRPDQYAIDQYFFAFDITTNSAWILA